MASTRIEQLCIEHGMKMTGQRRVIAQVLSTSGDHPDVEEVYRRASVKDTRISIATVYRTVRLLEEAGIIERHDFGDGRARYEESTDQHHDHLINVNTGEVFEFESPEIEALQKAIAKKYGMKLVGHRLELFAVPIENTQGKKSKG
ncbi:MAG: transcriptional repressor [Rhodospirillales bacterium]|nr:transcriptional repressor [Rhodospirillales bacterium]